MNETTFVSNHIKSSLAQVYSRSGSNQYSWRALKWLSERRRCLHSHAHIISRPPTSGENHMASRASKMKTPALFAYRGKRDGLYGQVARWLTGNIIAGEWLEREREEKRVPLRKENKGTHKLPAEERWQLAATVDNAWIIEYYWFWNLGQTCIKPRANQIQPKILRRIHYCKKNLFITLIC